MNAEEIAAVKAIMNERFGHDMLIALATVDGDAPSVRTVDGFYEDGCFYTITYALSNKVRQLEKNPKAGVSGEWFTGHGVAENLGWVRKEENKELADKLRKAYAAWYSNGDTNEEDPNTIILRIRLTDGVLANHGTWYAPNFTEIFG